MTVWRMRSSLAAAGLACLLAACFQTAPPPPDPCDDLGSARAQSSGPDWSLARVPGELLVVGGGTGEGHLGPAGIASLRRSVVRPVAHGIAAVSVPNGEDERAFASRVARDTGRTVQPNYVYRPLATLNDPMYARAEQDYLRQIRMPAAWDVRTAGARVAVIDTGADLDHPDLAGRLVEGLDFCPNLVDGACEGQDADPSDRASGTGNAGHGTHVAGIVGAATNNARGVAGITWSGVGSSESLLVVKAFGYDSLGAGATTASLAASIEYASDPARGAASVINLSLGLRTYDATADPALARAIRAADARGALMVAAAGNYDAGARPECKTVFYPASDPLVLGVGSVRASGTGFALSDFSARGAELDLVAPGENVGSTRSAAGTADAYELRSGTSQAAPQVAGVAALVRAANPALTPAEVRARLLASARDLGPAGRDDGFGHGLLDAGAALAAAR